MININNNDQLDDNNKILKTIVEDQQDEVNNQLLYVPPSDKLYSYQWGV